LAVNYCISIEDKIILAQTLRNKFFLHFSCNYFALKRVNQIETSMSDNYYYTDLELIAGCCASKNQYQYALYERFAPQMYAVAMRYAQTTLEADDILQISFIKIFEKIDTFKGDSPLKHWIKRIIINTALKQYRRQIVQAPKEELTDWNYQTDNNTVLADFGYQELLDFVQQLASGYRQVFSLYAIEGYKHREIAEMLNITEGASKSQYARAKVQLQKMILKSREEEETQMGQIGQDYYE